MASVEFSNADLADAIKRANIIAPTRGRELDMYKGFVFDLDPEDNSVRIRVTNGELFYTEFVYPVAMEAERLTTWRVASPSTFGIVSNLPLSGQVKFQDEGGKIRITSGKMRAATPLIASQDYPDAETFMYEPGEMVKTNGLGASMDLVGWCASQENIPPRCGIYMDRTHLCATNSRILARVENEFEFPDDTEFVVLPYNLIGGIMRTIEEAEVGIVGNNLVVSPTEDIYIKCSMFEPKFDPVNRVMEKEYTESLSFSKEEMAGALSRVTKIGSSDRQVTLDAWVGGGQITLCIKDRGSAEEIEESVDVLDGAQHELVKFMFSVEYFSDTVNRMPGTSIGMNYTSSKPTSVVKFTGDKGLEVAIQPRNEVSKKED